MRAPYPHGCTRVTKHAVMGPSGAASYAVPLFCQVQFIRNHILVPYNLYQSHDQIWLTSTETWELSWLKEDVMIRTKNPSHLSSYPLSFLVRRVIALRFFYLVPGDTAIFFFSLSLWKMLILWKLKETIVIAPELWKGKGSRRKVGTFVSSRKHFLEKRMNK